MKDLLTILGACCLQDFDFSEIKVSRNRREKYTNFKKIYKLYIYWTVELGFVGFV